MTEVPHTAMVLAAGLGRRMLPITQVKPKPLVEISGRPLIDWVIEPLIKVGVKRIVVNVHYFASQLKDYFVQRSDVEIIISDESEELLDTGGALTLARRYLGDIPIFVANTDAFWFPSDELPLLELARFYDYNAMDVALLLADRFRTLGYRGDGDFSINERNEIISKKNTGPNPYVYSGYRIEHPRIYDNESVRKFSVLEKWHSFIDKGRMFGMPLDRFWLHVGDPVALEDSTIWLSCYGR